MQVCAVSPPEYLQCGCKRPFPISELDYKKMIFLFGEPFQMTWEPYVPLPPHREIMGTPLKNRSWFLTRYRYIPPEKSSNQWLDYWTLILISPRKGSVYHQGSSVSLEENWTVVATQEPLKTPTGDFTGAVFCLRVWLGWKNQAVPQKWLSRKEAEPVSARTFKSGCFQRLVLKNYYSDPSPQFFTKRDLGTFNWVVSQNLAFDIQNTDYTGPEEDLKKTSEEFGERRVVKRGRIEYDTEMGWALPQISRKITVLVIPPQ